MILFFFLGGGHFDADVVVWAVSVDVSQRWMAPPTSGAIGVNFGDISGVVSMSIPDNFRPFRV